MPYRFNYADKFDNRIKKYKIRKNKMCHLLHDTSLIEQRINDAYKNPVLVMIVFKAEDYLYSSARDLAAEKGFVNVQTVL